MVTAAVFQQQTEQLAPTLYRIAQSILRAPHDAEDAVQEALIKLWEKKDRCKEETFGPYLIRIVINECRNIQRSRMRQTPVENLPESGDCTPENDLDLAQALDALPESLRLPLLLFYMEGWPSDWIAKALRISPIAVRNRLHRARKQLKITLTAKEGGVS